MVIQCILNPNTIRNFTEDEDVFYCIMVLFNFPYEVSSESFMISSQQTQNICYHLHNVGPTSSTLVQDCTNVIQMFCVYWEGGTVLFHVKLHFHVYVFVSRVNLYVIIFIYGFCYKIQESYIALISIRIPQSSIYISGSTDCDTYSKNVDLWS